MTEKILIHGKEIWVAIEPYIYEEQVEQSKERFTATYYVSDPQTDPGGILLVDDKNQPRTFNSPVEALEMISEKLAKA